MRPATRTRCASAAASAATTGVPAPGRRGRRPAGRPGAARRPYEAIAAVHRDDAYANLVLPGMLRDDGPARPGRRVRDRADVRHAAHGRHPRRDHRHRRRPGGRAHRPAGPRRAAARRLPAAATRGSPAHAAVSSTVDLVRPRRPGAAPASPTRSCARSPSPTCDEWLARSRPTRARRSGRLSRRDHAPSTVDRAGIRRGARRRSRRDRRGCSPRTTSGRRCTCALGRAGSTAIESGADFRAARRARFSPYAVYLPGGGARRHRGDPQTGGHTYRTRVRSWWRLAADGGARSTGPDERWLDLCAGPGGKAGLLGALAASAAPP